MFYDTNRLKMTRSPEDYQLYTAALTDAQKVALSRIGIENIKWLLEEYIILLKSENEPTIYITDFMSWIDNVMIVYDCNMYYEKLEKEMNDLMRGEYETSGDKKS